MEQKREVQNSYNNSVVGIGDWMLTLILLAIPLVNIILLFVWAFSSSTPRSKRNYAIALLIFMVIGIAISVFFWGAIITFLGSLGGVSGFQFKIDNSF